MSINAKITRTLIIDTPNKLYQILDEHKDLVEKSIELKVFMDQMNLSIQGCDCDSFEYVGGAISIYLDLGKIKEEDKILLKYKIGCDKIIFKMKDQILFEY